MRFARFIFLFTLILLGCSCQEDHTSLAPEGQPQLLVFYKTSGFYHASIPAGLAAIQKLGQENNFRVETSNDASLFTEESLSKYKAVVFLSTTGDVLDENQQKAFESFIRSGKGFVGVHAATDTEYDWPWYNQLVGAYFNGHPAIQPATIHIINKEHAATRALPAAWQRTDEWYNFKAINPAIKVLATLDESTYTGGTHGNNHPIAWYHEFDGGRAFYTAGGHTEDSYSEPLFLQHLLGGIIYAMGI